MGMSRTFACKTCKKAYYLGYGSGSSWIKAASVAEYLNTSAKYKDLKKNQNLWKCLLKHNGHDIEVFYDEYTKMVGNDLYNDGCGYVEDTLFIENYGEYEWTEEI